MTRPRAAREVELPEQSISICERNPPCRMFAIDRGPQPKPKRGYLGEPRCVILRYELCKPHEWKRAYLDRGEAPPEPVKLFSHAPPRRKSKAKR